MASDPVIALPAAWPALSIADARAALTAPGAKFEMETVNIRGIPTRVWKNAPPSLRFLIEASRAHGERLLSIYEDERVTFAANFRAVAVLANRLAELGVGKGDRVALAMRNLPEWPVAFFAATAIGAIMVPLNAWWTGAELEYGMRDSGASVLIVDDERHERLRACYATLPDLRHVLVARASGPVHVGVHVGDTAEAVSPLTPASGDTAEAVSPTSGDTTSGDTAQAVSPPASAFVSPPASAFVSPLTPNFGDTAEAVSPLASDFGASNFGDTASAVAPPPPAPNVHRLEDVIGTPHDYAALPDAALPPAEIAPDDDATILYTSGTTGAPKGALGTHRNLMTNIMSGGYAGARSFLRRGEAVPEPAPKVFLTVIPLFHATACSATLMGVIAGGSTIVYMRKWDPVRAMAIIERERVNVTGGVPTIAWQLIEHPERANYDLSSIEAIAYGGAPSAPELVRRIHEEFGALPGNGWGMTETTATVTSHSAEDYLNRPTSAGPPVATADLEIRAEDGVTMLPAGEVGELWARGPMIVKGYWRKPEASAETFVDGWVRTGDLARLDEEGFVYIVDRAKDMIIRGGENIYSSEVENCLYAHPAVTDCALIGLPHRTLGEEPAAVVHLAPGMEASEAELQAWVKARLAAFKAPVAVRFVHETLPRNANGKILKRELGALFAERVDVVA